METSTRLRIRAAMRHLLEATGRSRRRRAVLMPSRHNPITNYQTSSTNPMTTIEKPSWPKQSNVPSYYGKIELSNDGRPTERWEARSLTKVLAPYPLRLAWAPDTVVRKITCHRLLAPSLLQCLARILEHYGSLEAVSAAGMDLYGGCYNFRPMRGGTNLSMHSYGIAIDLDPDRNALNRKWEKGKGMMPLEVVRIFREAGWTWGGDWHRADCMHFQAASV